MYSTTLRGVFPEPKPIHRRNFIKENMRHLKQMQGFIQPDESKAKSKSVATKVSSHHNAGITKSKQKVSQQNESVPKQQQNMPQLKLKQQKSAKRKLEIKQLSEIGEIKAKEESPGCQFLENDRVTHRGIQTERSDDMNKIYECGVIKYPSPYVIEDLNAKKQASKKKLDQSDSVNASGRKDCGDVSDKLQNLNVESKPDFIKQNMLSVRQKTNKQENLNSANELPVNYQKGVVPKYLKERKEELQKEVPEKEDCPEGHVLLPEEERKETLRALRQSYADRIQELNSMPVRNDTLRMRKRKMELEEELRKIDEGIKVFQRPKVFVKINA